MTTKPSNLLDIPTAFCDMNGSVSTELLDEILSIVPQSGNFAKAICKLKKVKIPRTHDSKLELIATQLPNKEFRAMWYKNFCKRLELAREKQWYEFFFLIWRWLITQNAFFDNHNNPELDEFFVSNNGDRRIEVEKIKGLLDLSQSNGCEAKHVALFIWCQVENQIWTGKTSDADDLFKQIIKRIESEGDNTFAYEVHAQLVSPANGSKFEAPIIKNGQDILDHSIVEQGSKTNSKSSNKSDNHFVSAIQKVGKEKLAKILTEIESCEERHTQLINEFSQRELILDPDKFRAVKLEIKSLSERCGKTAELQAKYCSWLEERIEKLQQTQLGFSITAFRHSPNKVGKQWITEQHTFLDLVTRFEGRIKQYSTIRSKMNSPDQDPDLPHPPLEIELAIGWLSEAEKLASNRLSSQQLVIETKATSKSVFSGLPDNSQIWDWFAKPNTLTAFLLDAKDCPVDVILIGFALRLNLDFESHSYSNLIPLLNRLAQQSPYQVISALTLLNEHQLKGLWEHSHELRPWIRLSLIFSALEFGSRNSNSIARLYWDPLKDLHAEMEGLNASMKKAKPEQVMALIVRGIVKQEFTDLNSLNKQLNSENLTAASKIEKLSLDFAADNPNSVTGHVSSVVAESLRSIREHEHLPFVLADPLLEPVPASLEEKFDSDLFPHERYLTCFEKHCNGANYRWKDYLVDAVRVWANIDDLPNAVAGWIENQELDVLRFFCDRNPGYQYQDQPLKKWVDSSRKAVGKKLRQRIKNLELRLGTLSGTQQSQFATLMASAKKGYEEQHWKILDGDLGCLEELVNDALKEQGTNEERNQLIEELECLGGNAKSNMPLEKLRSLRDDLFRDAHKRQKHLEQLQDLLSIKTLSPQLKNETQVTLDLLKQPQNLPSESKSESFFQLIQCALDPLREFIEKPQLFHPDIYATVCEIALALMTIIRKFSESGRDFSKEEDILLLISKDELVDPATAERLLQSITLKASELGIAVRHTEESGDFGVSEIKSESIDSTRQTVSSINLEELRTALFDKISNIETSAITTDLNAQMPFAEFTSAANWAGLFPHFSAKLRRGKAQSGVIVDALDSDIFDCAFTLACTQDFNGRAYRSFRAETLQFLEVTKNSAFLDNKSRSGQQVARAFSLTLLKWLVADSCLIDDSSSLPNEFAELSHSLLKAENEEEVLKRAGEWLAGIFDPRAIVPEDQYDSIVLLRLWDLASAEKALGAEFRSWLMRACEGAQLYGALSFLFQRAPIALKRERAELACKLLSSARDRRSDQVLRSFLVNEVEKSGSKPFQLFAEATVSKRSNRFEWPLRITVGEIFERTTTPGVWGGNIEIEPISDDPPQIIVLNITDKYAKVSFHDGTNQSSKKLELVGPFLSKSAHKISLNLPKMALDILPLEVTVKVKTIQERVDQQTVNWRLNLRASPDVFVPPTAREIEIAFDDFPSKPVRGSDYIPRDQDERKIEHLLFDSKEAGSLWLTSPRRSGKTTMLFRILDEYSFRKNRDDIVLYFTLSRGFANNSEFNTWIWQRIANDQNNKVLESVTGSLGNIRSQLIYDIDVDSFLSDLSSKILERVAEGARVYFVFDEIDQFVQMYLRSEEKREIANGIMWQLRNLIHDNEKVGVVFSGSHAGRKFFVLDTDAPFYNSIASLNLLPFNTKDETAETRTRQITQPKKLRQQFDVPVETLDEILRITNGIPYYMKILAGATYSTAKQKRIYPADVKDGLRQLFAKETGLRIDNFENPGEDELRSLYARKTSQKILIKAVLLAAANISSPLDSIGVLRGDFWKELSPLVVDAGLEKSVIEEGLNAAIDMGFLKPCQDQTYRVEFAIPMLGESLRFRFRSKWAELSGQLENLHEQLINDTE